MSDPTKPQSNPAVVGAVAPPFRITRMHSDKRYSKSLFYGSFGSGKSSLAGSAVDVPEMRDVLIVDAESGTMSISEAEHIKARALIDTVRVTAFKQVAHVQEFLKAHCNARDALDIAKLKALQARLWGYDPSVIDIDHVGDDIVDIDATTGIETTTKARLRKYRTVIIDSLTEIDTFSMYQLLNIQTDMKLDKEMDVAQFAEFRKNNQMMQLLVRAYRDLPMNVILVCSTQYTQDEMKRMHWTPALTGKLSSQVQGFVDICGFLNTGKPAEGTNIIPRRLFIQPIGQFDAKSRIASFKESYIDDPSMTKIMAAFKKSA